MPILAMRPMASAKHSTNMPTEPRLDQLNESSEIERTGGLL